MIWEREVSLSDIAVLLQDGMKYITIMNVPESMKVMDCVHFFDSLSSECRCIFKVVRIDEKYGHLFARLKKVKT